MNYQLRISIHGLDSTASYHRSRMQAPLTPGPGDEPNKIGITMESSIQPVNHDEMDKGAMANQVSIGTMLLRWKCSVYKVVYKELIVFMVFFITVSLVYRLAMNEEQKQFFESSQVFFKTYTKMISLPFLLGFYVTIVAGRWWQQYMTIPWPDRLMLTIQMYISGKDEESLLLRRVLIRRALLMLTLLLRSITKPIRRRFPTLQDMVNEGIMTKAEKVIYESITPVINLYWVPSKWFIAALNQATKDGILTNHSGHKLIMEEFDSFRDNCGALWSYNWVSIPMVYTQVCTLAVYSYFIACLFSRQYVGENMGVIQTVDFFFPVWTILELIFYVGLLKVAESMKLPYGDDDQDFDLNFLINRHYNAAYLCLDYLNGKCPPLDDDDTPPHTAGQGNTGQTQQEATQKINNASARHSGNPHVPRDKMTSAKY